MTDLRLASYADLESEIQAREAADNTLKGLIVAAKLSEEFSELFGDYAIEPMLEGVTEKFVLTASWSFISCDRFNIRYCLYAGDTALTDSILDGCKPTVTAAGGFEGDNITIRVYSDDTELFRAKLKTVAIGSKKVGRLIRI